MPINREIYNYTDYKVWIRLRLGKKPARGLKTLLAQAMNCHLAYISQVLNGLVHLTFEQGEALCRYFQLDEQETTFFLDLLAFARAGTPGLRKYHEKRIKETRTSRKQISSRLKVESGISAEQEMQFYQSWVNVAVFVLTTIPRFSDAASIAHHLRLPINVVQNSLRLLEDFSLVNRKANKFVVGQNRLHLSTDKPILAKHHTNWRVRAIESLELPTEGDLHFSTVYSLSHEGAQRIHELLLKNLEEIEVIIKPSPEERAQCLCIDWFHI